MFRSAISHPEKSTTVRPNAARRLTTWWGAWRSRGAHGVRSGWGVPWGAPWNVQWRFPWDPTPRVEDLRIQLDADELWEHLCFGRESFGEPSPPASPEGDDAAPAPF